MRFSSVLVFLAACSSSSPRSPDAAVAGDGGAPSCGTVIATYCSANPCQRSLDGAKQDPTLCPASLTPCGDYDVIVHTDLDTSRTYYYFQGQLLAVSHRTFPGPSSCIAGPAGFTAPSCTQPGQALPVCR